MTREPGGIESEALQVEQVGGVVACIHREGEHEPGQDEAPGDERRREQCERGGSRDGSARRLRSSSARESRTGNGASARGAAESHASSATAVPGTPALAAVASASRSATMKSPESVGKRRAVSTMRTHRPRRDRRQHPSRPGGSGDGIRCDHGDRHAVGRLARSDAECALLGQEVADPCSSWRPAGAPPFRRTQSLKSTASARAPVGVSTRGRPSVSVPVKDVRRGSASRGAVRCRELGDRRKRKCQPDERPTANRRRQRSPHGSERRCRRTGRGRRNRRQGGERAPRC